MAVAVLVAVGATAGLRAVLTHSPFSRTAATTAAAVFVGSERCRSCHRPESDAWRGSHHKAAMAEATAKTVLGSFADATIEYAGMTSRFFKRDGKYYVRTDGSDGRLADFEIRYTFGVYPLQQYLVELPNGGGRIQALPIAWDARSKAEGGQRWFHLNADERVTSTDELHWTRPSHNWNYMCADCHSTAVRKNYDAVADRFTTQWSEVSVGCEACHGPGSRHVSWATAGGGASRSDSTYGLVNLLNERRDVRWSVSSATGNAIRSHPRSSEREIQTCAQCHSRRAQIADGYTAGKPYYDYYRPALLESPLYYADGQQRGEVYEWGSFLQSKMYAHGVTCSDCHDPHGGGLRNASHDRPSGVCANCHLATKYETPEHQHHPAAAGVTCVSCHMPTTTYMTVDARRDHSLRIPRPELTTRLGTPNACSTCHSSRRADWAAQQVASWRNGDTVFRGHQRFADALTASERGESGAQALLRALVADTSQPAIARATAASDLASPDDRATLMAVATALDAPNPLLRLGAMRSLLMFPPARRAQLVAPLLSDSMRAVRIDAAGMHPGKAFVTDDSQRSALEQAANEFVASQRYDADRAEGRTRLGTYLAVQGDLAGAGSELLDAIKRDPFFIPAYANLADVYRAQGPAHDADAEQILRRGLSLGPQNAPLHYALGLTLVRLGQKKAAVAEFERATTLAPTDARFLYTYAVALYSAGNVNASLKMLERLLATDENNRDALGALASYLKEQGHPELATTYENRLRALELQDPR
ncbi:MAG TPA: ammonia-forming cytochrome c nitrite reductase subunit c552 [Gemmatimonadaceae bacterium]|nr:ammonia-forming cytochrome c nitrite reductase subunit c552 [Gemmatimonadaceae bacterium]